MSSVSSESVDETWFALMMWMNYMPHLKNEGYFNVFDIELLKYKLEVEFVITRNTSLQYKSLIY